MAAKNAVDAPTSVTTCSATGASSNSGDSRATMNTPAVTMVAAWISAETGVGPSMASGSQVCSRNCADLPIAPMNSSRHSVVSDVDLVAEEAASSAPAMLGRRREHGVEADRAEDDEDAEDAEREAEIADAVDDEGLDGGRVGLGLLVPEADQQVGGEPDAFPAEEQLQEVVAVTSISMAKVNSDR